MYNVQFYALDWVRESELLLPFDRDSTSNLRSYRLPYYARAWDGISVLSWNQHLVHFCLGYIRAGLSIQLLAAFGRSFRRDEAPWDKWRPGDQVGLNGFEVEAIRRAIFEHRRREKQEREVQEAKTDKVVVAKAKRKRARKLSARRPALSKSELDHYFIESCFTLFELQCSITGRRIGGLDCRDLSVFGLIR
jgi:hypothetical protein